MTAYRYRWAATKIMGVPNEARLTRLKADGWEPVPVEEFPEALAADTAAFTGGSLGLYRMPQEVHDRRAWHQAYLASLVAVKQDGAEPFLFTEPTSSVSPKMQVQADREDSIERPAWGYRPPVKNIRGELRHYFSPHSMASNPAALKDYNNYWGPRGRPKMTTEIAMWLAKDAAFKELVDRGY